MGRQSSSHQHAEPKMFKKFGKAEMTGQSQVKSSQQRGIKASLIEQYPMLEGTIDELMPKKQPLIVVKCQNHMQLFAVNNETGLTFRACGCCTNTPICCQTYAWIEVLSDT